MLDTNALRGEIKRNGLTVAQTAEAIGMSPATLFRRLKTGGGLTLGEADSLIRLLGIKDPSSIFFSSNSPDK